MTERKSSFGILARTISKERRVIDTVGAQVKDVGHADDICMLDRKFYVGDDKNVRG